MKMKEIINKFNFKGVIISIEENTTGLINSTFFIISDYEKYVLQKINTSIFNDLISSKVKHTTIRILLGVIN